MRPADALYLYQFIYRRHISGVSIPETFFIGEQSCCRIFYFISINGLLITLLCVKGENR